MSEGRENNGIRVVLKKKKGKPRKSSHDIFAASFDELIDHEADIIQGKPAGIESEEFRGMPSAELETD